MERMALRLPVIKMHSVGNIILIVPMGYAFKDTEIIQLCHPLYGLGGDQVMVLDRPLKIWNKDGSQAEACGNGMRCVIAYLNPPLDTKFRIEGPTGAMEGWRHANDQVSVILGAAEILRPFDWGSFKGFAVTVGNPHWVILGHPLESLSKIGPEMSRHAAFPQGTNVSFVTKHANRWTVRLWERGAGPTLACGSAACAIAAVLEAQNLENFTSPIELHMPGGSIAVWRTAQGWVHRAPVTFIAHTWWIKD